MWPIDIQCMKVYRWQKMIHLRKNSENNKNKWSSFYDTVVERSVLAQEADCEEGTTES